MNTASSPLEKNTMSTFFIECEIGVNEPLIGGRVSAQIKRVP
jgi:hypothetical protein